MQICRLSGKRPAGGCDAVPVSLEGGGHEERSMLVTEYFVAGTEPQETCHLHVGRSLLGRLAGWLGTPASPPSQPQQSADHAEPVEPAQVVAPVSPAQQAPAVAGTPEPEKKRGFWSRMFGRRDRNAPEPPAEPKPGEKKPGEKKPTPRPR